MPHSSIDTTRHYSLGTPSSSTKDPMSQKSGDSSTSVYLQMLGSVSLMATCPPDSFVEHNSTTRACHSHLTHSRKEPCLAMVLDLVAELALLEEVCGLLLAAALVRLLAAVFLPVMRLVPLPCTPSRAVPAIQHTPRLITVLEPSSLTWNWVTSLP